MSLGFPQVYKNIILQNRSHTCIPTYRPLHKPRFDSIIKFNPIEVVVGHVLIVSTCNALNKAVI